MCHQLETVTGSAGRFVANTFGTAVHFGKRAMGEESEREIKDMPFARRMYGKQSSYIASSRYREKKKELQIFERRYDAAEGDRKRELRSDPKRKQLSTLKRYDKRIRKMNKKVDRLEARDNKGAAKIMKERIMQERKDFLLEVK